MQYDLVNQVDSCGQILKLRTSNVLALDLNYSRLYFRNN